MKFRPIREDDQRNPDPITGRPKSICQFSAAHTVLRPAPTSIPPWLWRYSLSQTAHASARGDFFFSSVTVNRFSNASKFAIFLRFEHWNAVFPEIPQPKSNWSRQKAKKFASIYLPFQFRCFFPFHLCALEWLAPKCGNRHPPFVGWTCLHPENKTY